MRQDFANQMNTFTPVSGKKKAPSQGDEGTRGLSYVELGASWPGAQKLV
jgi:hypothetical protein